MGAHEATMPNQKVCLTTKGIQKNHQIMTTDQFKSNQTKSFGFSRKLVDLVSFESTLY